MKKRLLFILMICCSIALSSYSQALNTGPGVNKKAWTGEQIGITKISIDYTRPGVKGREGKIWGTGIAHYGYQYLGFGPSQEAPWRAGADMNTIITFSEDVIVEGQPLAAGTYGLFMGLGASETTIIFSNSSTAWGSFFYDSSEDALRVTVKNQSLDSSVEWLKFEFINQTAKSTTIAMSWEKRMIPFKVESDLVKTHIASFKKQLQTNVGFAYQSFAQAAQFCLANNTELDQALVWAEAAVSGPFVGVENFQTLSLKAAVLTALNRQPESDEVMKKAIPYGSINELHQYARTLLAQGKTKEAFEVFKANYDKRPTELTTMIGLGRGYSALGQYKKALKYMKQALPEIPEGPNKASVEGMIEKLKAGKDANK